MFLKDSYEEGGRPTLNDMKFMNSLKFFAKDEINEETYELLEPLLKSTDWFTLDNAVKVSKAAAGIMKWAVSIADYYQKSKIVKPKKI